MITNCLTCLLITAWYCLLHRNCTIIHILLKFCSSTLFSMTIKNIHIHIANSGLIYKATASIFSGFSISTSTQSEISWHKWQQQQINKLLCVTAQETTPKHWITQEHLPFKQCYCSDPQSPLKEYLVMAPRIHFHLQLRPEDITSLSLTHRRQGGPILQLLKLDLHHQSSMRLCAWVNSL